jgi:hypothetical protein
VVEDGIGALHAGAGVAQDVEVHRARNIVGQVRGSRFAVQGGDADYVVEAQDWLCA